MESTFEICGSSRPQYEKSLRRAEAASVGKDLRKNGEKNSGIKPTPRQIKCMGIQRICVKQMGEAVRDE